MYKTLDKHQIADRISLQEGIIADQQQRIKQLQRRNAEIRSRFHAKSSFSAPGWDYAIGQCHQAIKWAKAEIAVLKKAQKEAAKKPVNKVLSVEQRGALYVMPEYPDCDFPNNRLCFKFIDKNGWECFLEVCPYHKPIFSGKSRKPRYDMSKSLMVIRGCYDDGRVCKACYEAETANEIELRATKAELLKFVNKVARDHYTRLSFKK